MTKLLIQHGPAKGQKIQLSLENKTSDGVIFAPREETIESIVNYCNSIATLNKDNVYIDPQFYYSTYNKDIAKLLDVQFNYPIEISRRDCRKNKEMLYEYFEKYVDAIKPISSNIITPGFSIEAIDWKFDYSIDFYNYFKQQYDFKRYYLSLMLSSKIFHSKNDTEDILEDLKDNIDEKDGVYLIINYMPTQDNNYDSIDPETLSNILYFIYTLKKENIDIIVGYTFLNSILYAMLDCEAVASGWFNKLRKFDQDRFESVDKFGKRKKRYFSLPTLTYMTIELIKEFKEDIDINILYSNTFCDKMALEDEDNVSFVDLEHQYWEALSHILSEINKESSIENKIKFVKNKISFSREILETIMRVTKNKELVQDKVKNSFKHIDDWIFAIELFEKKASLIL